MSYLVKLTILNASINVNNLLLTGKLVIFTLDYKSNFGKFLRTMLKKYFKKC